MIRFAINDEQYINSHGFRLMNAGARLERYNNNPVVLYQHNSNEPIGIGKDLRTDGTVMSFEPEFDTDDTLAVKVSKKVEKKHLKGCSPGIIVYRVESYTDESGKEEYRVTDWELCEISIVSVPSNRAAIRLYNSDMQPIENIDLALMADNDATNQSIHKTMEKTETPNPIVLTAEAAQALALSAVITADNVAALSAAISALSARALAAEAEVKKIHDEAALALVDEAVKLGKITADKKESFLTLAKTNYQVAKDTLDAIPAAASLSQKVTNTGTASGIPADRAGWSQLEWLKNDPAGLARLKAEDPETYQTIIQKRKNI